MEYSRARQRLEPKVKATAQEGEPMDKLRALHYLRSAAAERSFSGAARVLEVSVPAVAKMITALEKYLGIKIFDRTTQGLTLTAGGANYLEACGPALAQLNDRSEERRGG